MRKKRAIALALSIAERSDVFHRHDAVVLKDGKVLSSGKNRYSNDVVPSHHAEIVALSGFNKSRCAGAVLIVVRLRRTDGECGMSHPCDMCRRRIDAVGIKTVLYSTDDNGVHGRRR